MVDGNECPLSPIYDHGSLMGFQRWIKLSIDDVPLIRPPRRHMLSHVTGGLTHLYEIITEDKKRKEKSLQNDISSSEDSKAKNGDSTKHANSLQSPSSPGSNKSVKADDKQEESEKEMTKTKKRDDEGGGQKEMDKQEIDFDDDETSPYTDEEGEFAPEEGIPLLASRYKFVEVLARGQSALIVKALDTFAKNKAVAIKVLHKIYKPIGSQEADILLELHRADPWLHVPFARLQNQFIHGPHYCLVFEFLSPTPLYTHYEQRSIKGPTSLPHVRNLCVKLLTVLGFLHKQNVIHADLKPENILLINEEDTSSVMTIDFGNALRNTEEELSLYYTDFELQTLLYRAPEVIFGLEFGLEIDMWSLGCLLAECYTGEPLFMGKTKEDILAKITKLLGPFPKEFSKGECAVMFSQYIGRPLSRYERVENLRRRLNKCQDINFLFILENLFTYLPDKRISPFEAACHPFVASVNPFLYLCASDSQEYKRYPTVVLDVSTYPYLPGLPNDDTLDKVSVAGRKRLSSYAISASLKNIVPAVTKETQEEKQQPKKTVENHQEKPVVNHELKEKAPTNVEAPKLPAQPSPKLPTQPAQPAPPPQSTPSAPQVPQPTKSQPEPEPESEPEPEPESVTDIEMEHEPEPASPTPISVQSSPAVSEASQRSPILVSPLSSPVASTSQSAKTPPASTSQESTAAPLKEKNDTKQSDEKKTKQTDEKKMKLSDEKKTKQSDEKIKSPHRKEKTAQPLKNRGQTMGPDGNFSRTDVKQTLKSMGLRCEDFTISVYSREQAHAILRKQGVEVTNHIPQNKATPTQPQPQPVQIPKTSPRQGKATPNPNLRPSVSVVRPEPSRHPLPAPTPMPAPTPSSKVDDDDDDDCVILDPPEGSRPPPPPPRRRFPQQFQLMGTTVQVNRGAKRQMRSMPHAPMPKRQHAAPRSPRSARASYYYNEGYAAAYDDSPETSVQDTLKRLKNYNISITCRRNAAQRHPRMHAMEESDMDHDGHLDSEDEEDMAKYLECEIDEEKEMSMDMEGEETFDLDSSGSINDQSIESIEQSLKSKGGRHKEADDDDKNADALNATVEIEDDEKESEEKEETQPDKDGTDEKEKEIEEADNEIHEVDDDKKEDDKEIDEVDDDKMVEDRETQESTEKDKDSSVAEVSDESIKSKEQESVAVPSPVTKSDEKEEVLSDDVVDAYNNKTDEEKLIAEVAEVINKQVAETENEVPQQEPAAVINKETTQANVSEKSPTEVTKSPTESIPKEPILVPVKDNSEPSAEAPDVEIKGTESANNDEKANIDDSVSNNGEKANLDDSVVCDNLDDDINEELEKQLLEAGNLDDDDFEGEDMENLDLENELEA